MVAPPYYQYTDIIIRGLRGHSLSNETRTRKPCARIHHEYIRYTLDQSQGGLQTSSWVYWLPPTRSKHDVMEISANFSLKSRGHSRPRSSSNNAVVYIQYHTRTKWERCLADANRASLHVSPSAATPLQCPHNRGVLLSWSMVFIFNTISTTFTRHHANPGCCCCCYLGRRRRRGPAGPEMGR